MELFFAEKLLGISATQSWSRFRDYSTVLPTPLSTDFVDKRIILETAVGRAGVCGWQVGWQGATRWHGRSLQGGATPPDGLPAVQYGT